MAVEFAAISRTLSCETAVLRLHAMRRARLAGILTVGVLAFTGATAFSIRPTIAFSAGVPAVPAPVSPANLGEPVSSRAIELTTDQDKGIDRFGGEVGPDLTLALRRAHVPEAMGRAYVAVLGRAIPLANGLSVNDRFDLVVQHDPERRTSQLVYAGLDRVARADVMLLKWTDGKTVIWVNSDGVGGGARSSTMALPVEGRITSRFGRRFHPILGHTRFHKGVDVGARSGAPITAAADGTVASAGWHGGYGRQVAIAHAGDLETTYSHMSGFAVAAGQHVRRGQVIGFVGSSGLSNGPHVHFEVYRHGRPVNPQLVRVAAGPDRLQGEKLRALRDELRQLLLVAPHG